jgi:hypothetical protein
MTMFLSQRGENAGWMCMEIEQILGCSQVFEHFQFSWKLGCSELIDAYIPRALFIHEVFIGSVHDSDHKEFSVQKLSDSYDLIP